MDDLDLSPYLTEDEKRQYRSGNHAWLPYWVLFECWRLCDPVKYENHRAYHGWVQSVFDECDRQNIDMADIKNYNQVREWVISICKDVYAEFSIGCVCVFWLLLYMWEVRYWCGGDWNKLNYTNASPIEYRHQNSKLSELSYTHPQVVEKSKNAYQLELPL